MLPARQLTPPARLNPLHLPNIKRGEAQLTRRPPPPYKGRLSRRFCVLQLQTQGVLMASPNVLEFGSENWQKEVVTSDVPVLVDFWAPWCGPCRALSPIVDRLADQFAGKVKVGKVNVDEQGDLAAQYGINTIPRLLVFKGSSTPVQSVVGLRAETELAQMLKTVIG